MTVPALTAPEWMLIGAGGIVLLGLIEAGLWLLFAWWARRGAERRALVNRKRVGL